MVSTLRLEFFLFFIFLPSVMFFINSTKIVFMVLYTLSFITFYILRRDKEFKYSVLKKKIDWKFILVFFFLSLFAGYFYVSIITPELLFDFPKNNFSVWLLVMLGYPFLSVVPQEFIYRVFFFHRYKNWFNSNISILTVTNLFVFSYAHIVFSNHHAIFITALISPIFSYAYIKKSFFTCVIIHSIGGQIIFTLGLGKFFY